MVADRGSGTVTVISTRSDAVIDTLEMPPGDNPPEPMYDVYTPVRNRLLVGDRGNDRVVALWTIDTHTNKVVGEPVDAPYSVPHNIALTPGGRKLYLTHSGPNDKVSIYWIGRGDPTPALIGEVTTGADPFGLAWVP